MTPDEINDIATHLHVRLGRVMQDSYQLLDTEEEATLFFALVVSRLFQESCARLLDEPVTKMPTAESLLLSAMIMALIADPQGLQRSNLKTLGDRAQILGRKLKAAASRFVPERNF